ncbi:MAG: hypothetical protein OEX02_18675 [Cyclobacteriaceae bacterium]|nr:hypothetical protein [Cyclobacteriaceae bacterium]
MSLKPYLKYVYEVLAIIVGITISFMVDEWREERQNKIAENTYLKNIRSDLVQDTLIYTWNSKGDSLSVGLGIELWKVLFKNNKINNPLQFTNNAQTIGRLVSVEKTNTTFTEIQNSGMLKLIKNDSIRRGLIWYHGDTFLPTFNKLIEERTWKMQDNIIEQIPFEFFLAGSMGVNRDSLDYQFISAEMIKNLSTPEFEFLLKNSIRTIEQRKNIIIANKQIAKHLIRIIDEELEK